MAMAMIADSSSGDVTLKYDVFLSFSGETRKGFTNYLFDFLKSKGIDTFIDDELPRGEQIEASLVKTIKVSRIAVVVFSKNYASSSWCLDELAKIREFNLVIMPIFYEVKPDDVLKLSGEFGEKFAKLKSTENEVKIKKWSDYLAFAATQSGWDLDNHSTEIDLIKIVTANILKHLDSFVASTHSDEFSRYIGIASLVHELKRLLNKESSGVQFYGLWGMGGIGKTTIANALYHQLSPQFDGHYFYRIALDENDIRKLVDLRDKMIFGILGEKCNEGAPDQPSARVLSRLRKKKVLIVLDNVSTSDQVTTLVGSKTNPWFAFGSKIIVTSRDSQVLKNEVSEIQEIKEMSGDFALRLFCLHAFKQNQLPDDKEYVQFSKRIVDYAKGLPLALKVLGRALYERTKDEWRSILERLETRKGPLHLHIEQVLKISYGNLRETEKESFVDIACFLKGYDKDWVKDILGGITHLIDKCLVTVNPDNTLGMHDLLQKMGQDIAEEQKRKRSWRYFDSYNLLKNYQEEPKAIEGIFLDMRDRGMHDHGMEKLNIHPMIFSKMQNLRLLIIEDYGFGTKIKIQNDLSLVNLLRLLCWGCFGSYADRGVQFLPNHLRLLRWDNYPGEFLPSNFSAEYLVILKMQYSNLQRLWKEVKHFVNLKNLKVLDLSYSYYFTTLPDLTSAAKLEEIILDGCRSLLEIPASIQHLQSLSILSLRNCGRLCGLPNNFGQLNCLEKLILDGCRSLLEIPASIQHLQSLSILSLAYCERLCGLPDNFGQLNCLEKLILDGCENLLEIPVSIQHLQSLSILSLSKCERLSALPSLANISTLRKLDLRGCKGLTVFPETSKEIEELILLETSMVQWSDSMSYLNNLKVLRLPSKLQKVSCTLHLNSLEELCFAFGDIQVLPEIIGPLRELDLRRTNIKELPSSIALLSSLIVLDLSYCDLLETLPNNFGQLNCLEELKLSHCELLLKGPLALSGLNSIKELYLDGCEATEFPSWVCTLTSLQLLDLSCNDFVSVPNSITQLSLLRKLKLIDCELLETLPNNFGQLNCLENLELSCCKLLLKGPLALSGLNSIKELYLYGCEATEFPSWVCTLTSLQLLDLSWNDFVSVPDSIRQLSLLRKLNLSCCEHLQSVELPWQTISSDIDDGGKLIPHQFCFDSCKRLAEGARRNIVEKTMMRIQHVANRKDEVLRCPFTVSLPGDKIPEFLEFFEDRHDLRVTVELAPDLSSSTFRGLVVAVILSVWSTAVYFKCTLKKTDGSYLCSFNESFSVSDWATTERLALHYFPSGVIRKYCKDNLKDATHATFCFRRQMHSNLWEVLSCGVRLV